MRGAQRTNQLQRVAMTESRLKIPVLYGFDVIHGYRTIFPIPLAEASSFDPSLAERSAAVAAQEANNVGLRWTFAPMVDIRAIRVGDESRKRRRRSVSRRCLCARPRARFSGRQLRRARQGLACAKHWVAYGDAEGGRDYNTTDLSETPCARYFPPFKAAVDAGVGTLMSSFNAINGVPASANAFTLTKVRRNGSLMGLLLATTPPSKLINHGIVANEEDAAAAALNAGVDMEMVSRGYQFGPKLLQQKRLRRKRRSTKQVRRESSFASAF